jgi:hypothetical protein
MLRVAMAALAIAGILGMSGPVLASPALAAGGQGPGATAFWPVLPEDGAPERTALPSRLLLQEQPAPVYVPPAAGVAPAPAESQSITDRWWFWAAVGGVVAATLVVILIAGRGPSAPSSTLGNMDAFGGK